jgi:hypothetical protein
VCACSGHIYLRMGGQSIRTRRLDRNDGAIRRVAPQKGPDPKSCGKNPAVRRPLLKSEMRAILMMITNILREQSQWRV